MINLEMTPEQIANYARELMNSQSEIEAYLGNEIWDAIYTARDRVSSAIRCLSGRRGRSAEMDTLIDAVVARIRGEVHADTMTEEQRQVLRGAKKQELVELYNRESKRLSPNKVMYHQVSYERLTKPQIIALFAFLPKRYA